MKDITHIIATIKNSTPDSWLVFNKDKDFTLKINVNIRIVKSSDCRDFSENWTNNFDDKAVLKTFQFYYNNSLIDEQALVAVDGDRVYVPLPHIIEKGLKISNYQYLIGQIINKEMPYGQSMDSYLDRAGIEVIEDID